MADIDLIPDDYRTQMSQQVAMRRYAVSFAALIVLPLRSNSICSSSN